MTKAIVFRNISRVTTKLSTWSWVKNELLNFVAKDVFCKFYSRRLRKCFCDFCKKVVEVEQEKEYFVSRPVFFIFVAFLWMLAAHWLGALRGRRAFPENWISTSTNKSSTFAEKCGAAIFVKLQLTLDTSKTLDFALACVAESSRACTKTSFRYTRSEWLLQD